MRRLKQAYTALREQTCVGYAKIATMGGFCDLDIIVIKATSPDDLPLSERYIHQLLKIFSFSPSSFRAFSLSFMRRFSRTRCWRVALKCLILLHRLLRSLPDNSPFRFDLMWSRSNGLISLYPCRFCDTSSSTSSKDFTTFIHSYAHLLDEALDCFSLLDCTISQNMNELSVSGSFSEKIEEVGRILHVLPQRQSLIDRVIGCNPTRLASKSFLIRSSMKHILRESFTCYNAFSRDIIFLFDNLYQLQYRSCISALGIYKRAATQANQLSEFHESCKAKGLCGSYEYPFIDRIPYVHVRARECFLNGMWQSTESSASTSSASFSRSTSSFEDVLDHESDQKQLALAKTTVISTEWERFEEDEDEKEPLIQLEINDVSWEALLEASAAQPHVPSRDINGFFYMPMEYEYQHKCEEQADGRKMVQVYNQNYSFNPYYYYSYNAPNRY